MENLAARVGGGVVGYTIGNIPGAIYGYKAAGALQKHMAGKRKRTDLVPYRRGKKRKMYRSYGSKQINDNITTFHMDSKLQYRKKYMNKGKKRAWKKFVKKVIAVDYSQADFKTVVFNSSTNASTSWQYQGYACISLYGNQGTQDGLVNGILGAQDLAIIRQNEKQNYPSQNPPSVKIKMGKLQFDKAIIDATIRNTGTVPVEVDIYQISHYGDTSNDFNNFIEGWQNAPSQPIQEMAPTNVAIGDLALRGTTLFDKGPALSLNRVKIHSKRKLMLPVGGYAFLQHRDNKNWNYQIEAEDRCGYAIAKKTFHYVFIFKAATATTEDASIGLGVTRSYRYKTAFGENIDRSAYNPSGL